MASLPPFCCSRCRARAASAVRWLSCFCALAVASAWATAWSAALRVASRCSLRLGRRSTTSGLSPTWRHGEASVAVATSRIASPGVSAASGRVSCPWNCSPRAAPSGRTTDERTSPCALVMVTRRAAAASPWSSVASIDTTIVSRGLTTESRPGARISTRGDESACTSSCNAGGRSAMGPWAPVAVHASVPPLTGWNRPRKWRSATSSGTRIPAPASSTARSAVDDCPSISSTVPRGTRVSSPNGTCSARRSR